MMLTGSWKIKVMMNNRKERANPSYIYSEKEEMIETNKIMGRWIYPQFTAIEIRGPLLEIHSEVSDLEKIISLLQVWIKEENQILQKKILYKDDPKFYSEQEKKEKVRADKIIQDYPFNKTENMMDRLCMQTMSELSLSLEGISLQIFEEENSEIEMIQFHTTKVELSI